MEIILASSSKRRKDIFDKIDLKYKIIDSKLDEKKINLCKKKPHLYSMNMAFEKATIIAKKFPEDLIIAADTIVFYNEIIEKPENIKQATNYLMKLSEQTHYVYTGVSILSINKKININFYEKTSVTFNKLSSEDIKYYINKYKPYDKSGGYGIQDWSCLFAKSIKGCFYNVVGFPISKFYGLIKKNKIQLHFNG